MELSADEAGAITALEQVLALIDAEAFEATPRQRAFIEGALFAARQNATRRP